MNYSTITLSRLDGSQFYIGWFESFTAIWSRIVEVVAEEFNCGQDEITLLETDEGDMVCVGMVTVARIQG